MLVGYNTNVPYKGKLYHVQTEDNGVKNPVVITLLYISGTILAAKKTSYADLVASPDYKEKVREIMKEQHKTMMKELIRGMHTSASAAEEAVAAEIAVPVEEVPTAAETQKAQISRSLDDILLDYIMRQGE